MRCADHSAPVMVLSATIAGAQSPSEPAGLSFDELELPALPALLRSVPLMPL